MLSEIKNNFLDIKRSRFVVIDEISGWFEKVSLVWDAIFIFLSGKWKRDSNMLWTLCREKFQEKQKYKVKYDLESLRWGWELN